MVNPLPLRNLNGQTSKLKVQELLQLLLNNPVRTLLALLLTRGLWIPILKRGGYFVLVGLGLLSQLVVLPIDFLVGRLPPLAGSSLGILGRDRGTCDWSTFFPTSIRFQGAH